MKGGTPKGSSGSYAAACGMPVGFGWPAIICGAATWPAWWIEGGGDWIATRRPFTSS